MTIPTFPAKNSEDWYEWARGLDIAGRAATPFRPINAQHVPYMTAFADKPLVSLRFDDADSVNATVGDYCAARNLPYGVAVHTLPLDGLTTGGLPYLTTAQLLAMQQRGAEIMCHSKTHGAGPADDASFLDETVGAAEILRGKGLNVQTFTQPGTWTNAAYALSSDALYETFAGRLFMANFLGAQGYRIDDYGNANYNGRPFPVLNRYGARPLSADGYSLAGLQSRVERAISSKASVEIFWHLRNADLDNVVYPFLNWLRTQRDAGRIDVVTPGFALNAQRGTPINLCPEGDFVAMQNYLTANPGATSYDYSNWNAAVSTNTLQAGRESGRYAIRTPSANQARWVVNGIGHLRSVFIEGWVKSADGTGACNPRGMVSVSPGGRQDLGAIYADGGLGTATTDATWRKVQWLVGVPPGANSLTLVLYAYSGSPVWTDFTIRSV